jgi:hypothetical protein
MDADEQRLRMNVDHVVDMYVATEAFRYLTCGCNSCHLQLIELSNQFGHGVGVEFWEEQFAIKLKRRRKCIK